MERNHKLKLSLRSNQKKNLFAGQGYRILEAKMVNVVIHFMYTTPEEWTDEVFGSDRGPEADVYPLAAHSS